MHLWKKNSLCSQPYVKLERQSWGRPRGRKRPQLQFIQGRRNWVKEVKLKPASSPGSPCPTAGAERSDVDLMVTPRLSHAGTRELSGLLHHLPGGSLSGRRGAPGAHTGVHRACRQPAGSVLLFLFSFFNFGKGVVWFLSGFIFLGGLVTIMACSPPLRL